MKKTDNLLAWRAFLAVAKTGSMSLGANLLDLDSPTISRLVGDLEKELGYALLDRSVRPFSVTARGRVIADAATPLANGFADLVERFEESARHVIVVAAPTDLNQLYLHDQLMEYSASHPGIRFYLRSSCPVEDILSGRVDVALIDKPISSVNLVVRFCMQAKAVPMASRGYIEKHGYPKKLEDLKHHTGLLLRQGMHPMTSFLYDQKGCISPALRWGHVFMTDAQLTLDHMMLDDRGVVIDCVPQHLLKELREGLVVPVLPGWSRKPQELCLVTRRDREGTSDELHEFVLWWRQHEKTVGGTRVAEAEQALEKVMAAYRHKAG